MKSLTVDHRPQSEIIMPLKVYDLSSHQWHVCMVTYWQGKCDVCSVNTDIGP